MAIDYTTNIGKVRVLTGDTRELMPDGSNGLFMSDAEITAILGLESNNITLSAATTLEVMATKQAIIMQRIKTLDLQTDGPAVAKALLDRAKMLRDSYQKSIEDAAASDFEIIELMFNDNQVEDWIYKQYLKGSI